MKGRREGTDCDNFYLHDQGRKRETAGGTADPSDPASFKEHEKSSDIFGGSC